MHSELRFVRSGHIYVGPPASQPPAPLHFPEEEEAPETGPHLEIRTALFLILKMAFGETATIGSEQFVYWDPTSAAKRCAPDAFVKLGRPHETFNVWKVWERGAPDLAVEVVSKSDRPSDDWNSKLERYRAAGVSELVRFDATNDEQPIRVWDRVDGELVERAAEDPEVRRSRVLDLFWTTVQAPQIGPMLRLSRDAEGTDLLPTPEEAAASAEVARMRAEAERGQEAEARRKAEAERDALLKELEELRKGTRPSS